MNTLTQIANSLTLDKGNADHKAMPWHAKFPHHRTLGYTEVYERYMNEARGNAIKLLEIGVCDQRFPLGSLKMWKEYAPEWNITALDFFVEHARGKEIQYSTLIRDMGVKLVIGDQSRADTYTRLPAHDFDFIIEDGSHIEQHMMFSLLMLCDRLTPGGHYFMEDIDANSADFIAALKDFQETGMLESPHLTVQQSFKIEDNLEPIELWPSPSGLSHLAVFKSLK